MSTSSQGSSNRNSNSRTSLKPSPNLKSKPTQRRNTTTTAAPKDHTTVPGRVRVAVRLRPRNAEESVADADFADCVELQPELKRLKLRKNNWDGETYEFDEVLTEFASQKRVYEVVARPVVESVLDGYNGTIMAYGQTGTGKTYTLGRLGEEDTAARGIMVRAMEDIFANVSLETDSVSVSYLQLYMETIQDLLDPANDNIAIAEDPKTGDVSLPGATLVEIRDQQSFIELLSLGEAHRFAANTKMNTESSRSHAILMVHVKRSVKGRDASHSSENGNHPHMVKSLKPLIVRKAKLVIVDLAGSERIDKSGSEGHMLEEAKSINLSLSALGKCINSLAENSAHVPIRDSKLTRLLRDSFGVATFCRIIDIIGKTWVEKSTARTSLVITIGPSPRHRAETASTIMFGQRAMKVENMIKLKEEFDYKSLSRRLDIELDKLIMEHERQQKAFEDEIERLATEAHHRISEAERNYADSLEKERSKYQKDYMESIKKLEEKFVMNQRKNEDSRIKSSSEIPGVSAEEMADLKKMLQKETLLRKAAEGETNNWKIQVAELKQSEASAKSEISKLHKMLEDEAHQKEKLEGEIAILQSQLLQLSLEADE
ncbi:armadillo repeat-containing kinesin-like protein 3-like, partial [Trifolium pratense]